MMNLSVEGGLLLTYTDRKEDRHIGSSLRAAASLRHGPANVWQHLARLLVGLGHIDRHAPAHLLGRRRVAGPLAGIAEGVEDAAKDIDVEIGNAHVGEAALGHEVDGFQAAGARYPDGRVRLL